MPSAAPATRRAGVRNARAVEQRLERAVLTRTAVAAIDHDGVVGLVAAEAALAGDAAAGRDPQRLGVARHPVGEGDGFDAWRRRARSHRPWSSTAPRCVQRVGGLQARDDADVVFGRRPAEQHQRLSHRANLSVVVGKIVFVEHGVARREVLLDPRHCVLTGAELTPRSCRRALLAARRALVLPTMPMTSATLLASAANDSFSAAWREPSSIIPGVMRTFWPLPAFASASRARGALRRDWS